MLLGRYTLLGVAAELLSLEHDEVLVDGLQQGVTKTGTAIEEASLAEVEQQELEQRTGGQPIEELLLMVAAAMEVLLGECGAEAEGITPSGGDLKGFEGTVSIVAVQPVGDALAEGSGRDSRGVGRPGRRGWRGG